MSGCLGVQLPLVWKMMTGCMHFNTVAHSDTHTQKLGVPGPQWQPKNPPISCTLQSQTLQTTSLRALPTISRDPLTRQGEHKRSHITYTVPEVNTHTYIYIYMAGCRWHLLLKPDFPPWPAWGEFFGVFRGVGPNGPGPRLPSPARLRSVRVEH